MTIDASERPNPGEVPPPGENSVERVVAGSDPGAVDGRVLIVAPQPFYEDRGTPIAVRQVLQALSEIGYEIDVLTYPVGQSIRIPGVRYLRVANPLRFRSVPIGFSLKKLILDAIMFVKLTMLLRQRHYACVHAVEEAAFLAVLAARRRGLPVIYDMQSSMPEQLARHPLLGLGPLPRLWRAAEAWLIRRADLIVSSAGLADRVSGIAPGAWIREWHYATPVNPAGNGALVRERFGIEPDERVVLYTGNFEDYQGLSLFISAMPSVLSRVPNAVFLLVGANGHHTDMARRRLEALMPDRAYRLVPRQPREAISDFLALADVVVSPRTRGSNLPIKVLEYLAAGRAIVATEIPAHRSVLNEQRAVLVEARTEALARAIATLLEDPERVRQLEAAASRFARDHLSWSDFVGAVGGIYDAARGNGRSSPAGLSDHPGPELAATDR